jgi:hypothetical protein
VLQRHSHRLFIRVALGYASGTRGMVICAARVPMAAALATNVIYGADSISDLEPA